MMEVFGLQYPGSKWRKHLVLWKDPELRPYLPETLLFNESNLLVLLRKYPAVFIKPSCGSGGKGIIKASRIGSKCMVQIASHKTEVNISRVYGSIKRRTAGRSYIVQQGVDLAAIDGKPVDYRVLLLKPGTEWKFMGIMGKVAVKNHFVTNHCRGGSSILFRDALNRSLQLEEKACDELAGEMKKLSFRIALALQKKFKLINELGLDIAVDNRKKLWLLEANTRPQYQLFRDHDNPELYRNIDRTIRTLRQRNKAV